MVLCLDASLHHGYTTVASAVRCSEKGTSTDALTNVSRSYSMFVFKKRHGRHGDAFLLGVSGNDSGLVADSAGITWMEEVSATSSVPAGGSEISTCVDRVPESPLEMESISGRKLEISESLSSPER